MNSEQYFLDASFLIALIDSTDVHHARANLLKQMLINSDKEIFLSDVLVNEVMTGLKSRCRKGNRAGQFPLMAKKVADFMVDQPILCLYELINQNYGRLISMMVQSDGKMSFHDCLIAFFLKQIPEVTLVTFDKDFNEVKGLKILSD